MVGSEPGREQRTYEAEDGIFDLRRVRSGMVQALAAQRKKMASFLARSVIEWRDGGRAGIGLGRLGRCLNGRLARLGQRPKGLWTQWKWCRKWWMHRRRGPKMVSSTCIRSLEFSEKTSLNLFDTGKSFNGGLSREGWS